MSSSDQDPENNQAPHGSRPKLNNIVLFFVVLIVAGIFGSSVYFARKAAHSRSTATVLPLDDQDAAAPTKVTYDLPPFSLTERSGKTITLDSLKGNVWIADFIFTTCAGPCPMMTRQMSNIQSELAGVRDVKLLTITVDPKTDTPPVLTEYARKFRAMPEKWLFLTGPREDIYSLCTNGFKLAAVVDDQAEQHPDHPILHSTKFVLIDREGKIRAYYDGTSEESIKRLQSDARKLAAEGTI